MKNGQVVTENVYLQITIFLRSTFHILLSCKIKILAKLNKDVLVFTRHIHAKCDLMVV